MKKDEPTNSFISNGGWKEVEVYETIYGFKYYLVWAVLILLALIGITYAHIQVNDELFTLEYTGQFVIVGFLAQVYITWKLIKSFGKKTVTVTNKVEVDNPDYDTKNLY